MTGAMTFLARMKVKPEAEADFIHAVKDLSREVHAHEPDTLIYEFYRSRIENEFVVIESFRNEAAEEAHRNTPYFNEIAPRLIACIDGTYHREYFDPVG